MKAKAATDFAACLDAIGVPVLALDLSTEKPDSLSYLLASFVAHAEAILRSHAVNGHGAPMNLEVGVTLELDGNAFAMLADTKHCIGITFGHFLSSSYFAIEAFFRTRAFLDIGAAPGNDAEPFELCPTEGFWDAKGPSIIAGFGALEAGDQDRAKTCYFLIYAITMLAYLHEYFHVVLGHCSVMATLGLKGRVLEVGGSSLSADTAQVSRALEALADRNAIVLLIKMILQDADLCTAGGAIVLSQTDRLRLVLVGAGLLTASWFSWQQRFDADDDGHPSPSVRFKQFFLVAKAALEEHGDETLFATVGNQAIVDLANIAFRCPELGAALWSIAEHKTSPGEMVGSLSPSVEAWLDEEAFRLG